MTCAQEKEKIVFGYFFKRVEYCLGSGLELLSASFVAAVCHDSKVLRFRKVPLSITIPLSESIEWS